ncbi:MAG: triose-phosphate isomerase [Parcubacteria group bacterium]|nr:MAG: triose-phosphate isomerase [Parcubacteria group bacterium]
MKKKKKNSPKSPFVVANWKMNLLFEETEELILELRENLKNFRKKCRIVVFTSYTSLDRAREILIASKIELGAQDVFWELEGNFTSQISVKMLNELDCKYVIIGHSERRKYAQETDEMVDRKTVACVRNKLTPIVCVGETREQRRERVHHMVVTDQVKKALRYVSPLFSREEVIIAYEPVWSIYPGQLCEPSQAKEMAMVIRQALIDLYPEEIVEKNFSLIYGGSVNEKNVEDYIDSDGYNGVLIGNASLDANKFTKIINKVCIKCKKGQKIPC